MTATGPTPLEQAVLDIHTIAGDTKRTRGIAYAILASSLIGLGVGVLVAVLIAPVYRTANIVEKVAGPDAIARQGAEGQITLNLVLCKQRENTSESREMDGKPPLPLKAGCPPYNYAAPYLPPATTTTSTTTRPTVVKSKTVARPTTTRPAAPSTTPGTTAVTTTTRAAKPCTSLPIIQTCLP